MTSVWTANGNNVAIAPSAGHADGFGEGQPWLLLNAGSYLVFANGNIYDLWSEGIEEQHVSVSVALGVFGPPGAPTLDETTVHLPDGIADNESGFALHGTATIGDNQGFRLDCQMATGNETHNTISLRSWSITAMQVDSIIGGPSSPPGPLHIGTDPHVPGHG